jgi:hypothetical protein
VQHHDLHLGGDVERGRRATSWLVADDSAYEYEKLHLPKGAWPPTAWFADWASGLDLFDVAREESPIDLRWLVYQKA